MKRLLDGVWAWSAWKQGAFLGVAFNGHYLESGSERLLVDPPPPSGWDLEHFESLGAPTQVIVTNAHHVRASVELAERFGAGLHVPLADAARIGRDEARSYVDGEELFGLAVVSLRDQKTPGESALHWPERRLLLVGDALIGAPKGSLCMLPAEKFHDVEAARSGLRRLAELDFDVLLTGDGEPILRGASEALHRFLRGGAAAEAALAREAGGLAPEGPGWFVLNLAEARWMGSDQLGAWSLLESARAPFRELGVNVTVLQPGQPSSRYHRESTQEGFLVLDGACTLVVEETERRLKTWDYVHCPAGTAHVFVGAGDGPCAILMMGARAPGATIHYPVSEAAGRHGASASAATDSAEEAYRGCQRPGEVAPAWPRRA